MPYIGKRKMATSTYWGYQKIIDHRMDPINLGRLKIKFFWDTRDKVLKPLPVIRKDNPPDMTKSTFDNNF